MKSHSRALKAPMPARRQPLWAGSGPPTSPLNRRMTYDQERRIRKERAERIRGHMDYLATDLAIASKHGNAEPVQAKRYLKARDVLRKARAHVHTLYERHFR